MPKEKQPPAVLVVDDDAACCALAAQMLNALGYQAHATCEVDELLVLCHRHRPVAMLLDVEMPAADGRDVVRRLRSLQRTRRLEGFAIIGCIGANSPEEVESCVGAGMDACLAKPIEMMRLATELSRLTGTLRFRAAFPFRTTTLDNEV